MKNYKNQIEYLLEPFRHSSIFFVEFNVKDPGIKNVLCLSALFRCPNLNLASRETESKNFFAPAARIQSELHRFCTAARRASNDLVSVRESGNNNTDFCKIRVFPVHA